MAMVLVMGGGYLLYKNRNRGDPLKEDFEKGKNTRHLVDMHQRIDKDKLRAWLEESEKQTSGPDAGKTQQQKQQQQQQQQQQQPQRQ